MDRSKGYWYQVSDTMEIGGLSVSKKELVFCKSKEVLAGTKQALSHCKNIIITMRKWSMFSTLVVLSCKSQNGRKHSKSMGFLLSLPAWALSIISKASDWAQLIGKYLLAPYLSAAPAYIPTFQITITYSDGFTGCRWEMMTHLLLLEQGLTLYWASSQ